MIGFIIGSVRKLEMNEVFNILPSDFFEKVVKTARIRCFSKKREIKRTVGKNIEKGYKIVLFCKKSI